MSAFLQCGSVVRLHSFTRYKLLHDEIILLQVLPFSFEIAKLKREYSVHILINVLVQQFSLRSITYNFPQRCLLLSDYSHFDRADLQLN